MGRVISYGEKTAYNDGDYLLLDNSEGGTKRIRADRVGVQLDPSLTDPNKAAPADKVKKLDDFVKAGLSIVKVNLKSLMADHDKVYLYTGIEPNESTGYWYYWNGTDFVPGGQYGAGVTDAVPTQGSTNAVSSGGVYAEFSALKEDFDSKINDVYESDFTYMEKIASSKNLIDPDALVTGAITNIKGTINDSTSFRTTDYIRVFANQSITFSPAIKRLLAYDIEKNPIAETLADISTGTAYTFTPTVDGYVRVSFSTDYLDTIQGEYGSSATTYSVYQFVLNDVGFGTKQNGLVQDKITENLLADKNYHAHELLLNATVTMSSSTYQNSVISSKYASGVPHVLEVENNIGDSLTTVLDFTHGSVVNLMGMAYATLKLFVENANKLTSIRIIYRTSANKFARDKTYTSFTEGWNEIRLDSFDGIGVNFWEDGLKSIRMFIVSSNGSKIRFYGLEGYYPKTAKICFIDDVGYEETLTNLYPGLSALNIPTAWACQYGSLGSVQANRGTRLSLAELQSLADDSMSEFTFHTYNGGDSSSMTAKQAGDDTLKCIRFMEANGLKPNKVYRGAWLSNRCTYPHISDTLLDASATPDGATGLCTFPFSNVHDIPRTALHGSAMTNEKYDEYFEKLRLTHATFVCYTHSVAPSVTEGVTIDERYSMSASQASYFIQKCTTGVNNGWLEGTTISRLLTYGEDTE